MILNVGIVEASVAVLAIVLSLGAYAMTYGERVRSNEQRLVHIEGSNKESRETMKDLLIKLNKTQLETNVILARVDERLKSLEKD